MLIGTTYAWFTDSASSDANIIQAGNLDVNMEWAVGTADPETTSWNATEGTAIFNNNKWEPGYAEVRHIKISNKGSLALKYKVLFKANGKVSDLADVIDVYYADPAKQVSSKADLANMAKLGTLTQVLASLGETGNGELLADQADTITLALVMQETAGNEYAGKAIGGTFSIYVLATQLNSEEDSFGKDYDKDADYKKPEQYEYETVYIYDLEDFTEFGKAVNSNIEYNGVKVANNNKVWVEVMNDIDMTNAPGIQGDQFSIGNGDDLQFRGVFDGNNHIISNYSIKGSWTYNVSLFRTVSGDFTMKDITFENCSASKPNNRISSILVGTIGGGTITFDNVDIKNSTVNGVDGASAYVGKITEGAIYFRNCDVDNVTLKATSANANNAIFLSDGYSHHDYEASGVWVENCTIKNSKSIVNGVEEATVKEYNYTK
jgi:predicted ribosomally synthesized peptide with SipW-like signal peptide